MAKLASFRRMPPLPAKKKINGIWFEYDSVHTTAPMYFGSYSLALIDVMKRCLKPGDTFLDIGANIGYLSAIAAGLVGKTGQVHSFEPVPAYFRQLQKLAALNPEYTIVANPFAAGSEEGTAKAYVSAEPGENTLVPGYTEKDSVKECIDVRVIRLDEYIESKALKNISLIKIDTEGFEYPVLLGLQGFFEKTENLPIIICEVDPRAHRLLGHKPDDLASYISGFGYGARNVVRRSKTVELSTMSHIDDVVFSPPASRITEPAHLV
ncbi:MAG TPA: FkbM family methyltransferase [Terriglobales bacterium]|nr:FkbM family methyltransferase [Terriglobales bacterium]